MKIINFEKKESDTINKRTAGIRDAVHSVCNLKNGIPNKFLWFFTMDQTMIIILS